MSYSAFFTSGLPLVSQPRTDSPNPPSLHINILPGTPRRSRKRRSSLTIATSPIATVKSPTRAASDAIRTVLRSPREGSFLDALKSGVRPKMPRRKTVSHDKELPCLPAPTSPLPMLPNLHIHLPSAPFTSSMPTTPTDDAAPSSPITADSPLSSIPTYIGTLRSNPARRSSFLLPVGRGPFASCPYSGNMRDNLQRQLDMGLLQEEKTVSAVEWFDDEDMKENDGDA